MGQNSSTHCELCGHKVKHFFGIGAEHSSLESVVDLIQKHSQEKVKEILNSYQVHSAKYSHSLFECPYCDTAHNRFYLKLDYGNKQTFETQFRCGDCRASLIPATKSADRYFCRKCGEKTLKQDFEMELKRVQK